MFDHKPVFCNKSSFCDILVVNLPILGLTFYVNMALLSDDDYNIYYPKVNTDRQER